MREIKFRGINKESGNITYGYSPSFLRTLRSDSIEEFVGRRDCNNRDIYTNDQLYSVDTNRGFHFKWSHINMGFEPEWSDKGPGILDIRKKTLINFSLKPLLTKDEFKEKYFTNSFYFIDNDTQGIRIQCIALFMGLLLHNNNADIIEHIELKMLMMFAPSICSKVGYFEAVDLFISNASYGEPVDVNAMFADFEGLHDRGLL